MTTLPPPATKLLGTSEGYELVYREAIRSLEVQSASLDGLRTRAGILLSAAAIVGGFLASDAFAGTRGGYVVAAAGLFIVAAFFTTYLLLPIADWRASFDVKKILADYVETSPPASIEEIHRSLAYHMQDDREANERVLKWRNTILTAAAVLVSAAITLWLIAVYV